MEATYAALQRDLASCQGELAARCDDLEVLRDAHAAAEAQVTQQSQDIQVSHTMLAYARALTHFALSQCKYASTLSKQQVLSRGNNVPAVS